MSSIGIAILFFHTFAFGGFMEVASQGAAKLWGGVNCETETKSPSAGINCETKESPLGKLKSAADEGAEDILFAELAKQHAKELKCSADFAEKFSSGSGADRETVVTSAKLLREAKQRLVAASAKLSKDPSASVRTCPLSMSELKPDPNMIAATGRDSSYDLCKEIIVTRTAYQSVFESIPLSGSPAVKSYLEKYANLPEGADLSSMEHSLDAGLAKAYGDSATSIRDAGTDLGKRAEKGGSAFGRGDRYGLLSDERVVAKVVDGAGDARTSAGKLACKADQRYHSGADALERTAMIGSIAVGGSSAVALRVGSAGARVATAANAARSAGLFSLNAARAVQVSATGLAAGLDGLGAYSQIDRDCFSKQPSLKAAGTDEKGECVSAPKIEELSQNGCVVSASLTAIGYSSALLPALAKAKQIVGEKAASAASAKSPAVVIGEQKIIIDDDTMKAVDKLANPGKTEIESVDGAAQSLKYRQLAMHEDEFSKIRQLTSDSSIPADKLPSATFDVYKEARLRSLNPEQREKIEKILNNVKKEERTSEAAGNYNHMDGQLTMSLGKDGIEDLQYHRVLAHEMEHAIQSVDKSKKRVVAETLLKVAFSKRSFHQGKYLDELGANKAEFDYLRAIPADGLKKMTAQMREAGSVKDAENLEVMWTMARTDIFPAYRAAGSYPSMEAIKQHYPLATRERVILQAVILGTGTGGYVGAKAVCNKIFGLMEKECSALP